MKRRTDKERIRDIEAELRIVRGACDHLRKQLNSWQKIEWDLSQEFLKLMNREDKK